MGNRMEYVHRTRFGENREKAIVRDKEMCVKCGMTRKEHREKWDRDITVDHKDKTGINCKIKNNKLSNLQTLCLMCHTKKDNKNRNFPKGSKHWASKLDEGDVKTIRKLYSLGNHTMLQISKLYSVHSTLIGLIINRKIWKHI